MANEITTASDLTVAAQVAASAPLTIEEKLNAAIMEAREGFDGTPNFGAFHRALSGGTRIFSTSVCEVAYPDQDAKGELKLYNGKDLKVWISFYLEGVIDYRTGDLITNSSAVEVFIPKTEISKYEGLFGTTVEAGKLYLQASDSSVVRFSFINEANAQVICKAKNVKLSQAPHVTVVERKAGLGLSYDEASLAKTVATQVQNGNDHYLAAASQGKVSGLMAAMNNLKGMFGS